MGEYVNNKNTVELQL